MADRENRKIVLYYQSSHRLELYKKLSKTHKLEISPITIKENCSIENPHFIIKTPDNLNEYNYLYSYDFQYYYFIDDVIVLPQGQVELVCAVDPLYSLRKGIGNLVVHEERATDGQTNLVVDNMVSLMHNTIISEVIPLPMKIGQEFNGGNSLIVDTYSPVRFSVNGTQGVTNTPTQNGGGQIEINLREAQMSSLARKVAKAIGDKAVWYKGEYDKFLTRFITSDTVASDSKVFNAFFAYTMERQQDVDYLNRDHSLYTVLLGRHDTMYNELQVTIPGEQTPFTISGMRNTSYGHNPTPLTELDNSQWCAWDCSQFAWRCAMFNGEYPINISNTFNYTNHTTSVSGDFSAGEAVHMANRFVYYDTIEADGTVKNHEHTLDVTSSINSRDDLMVGDIVISGNQSKAPRYWIYQKKTQSGWGVWGYVLVGDGIGEMPESVVNGAKTCTDAIYNWIKTNKANNDELAYVAGVNHAFVIGEEGKIYEAAGTNSYKGWCREPKNQNTSDISVRDAKIKNVLCVRDIPSNLGQRVRRPCDAMGLMHQLDTGESGFVYRVFRPAYEMNDGRVGANAIPYSEWHDLKEA